MSGISAAQYLRRAVGVVVYAKKEEDKTYCIVKQGDKEISRQVDDNFGTLSWLTCETLFNAVSNIKKAHRRYPVPPAASFFHSFDANVIKTFDLEYFVDEILPKLKGKTNIWNIAKKFTEYDFNTDDELHMCEIYDWIVRVWVELRKMKWEDSKITIPEGTVPTPIMQALTNLQSAQFVLVPKEFENLIPALKAVHPDCIEVDNIWVMDPKQCETDPFGLSGNTFTAIDYNFEPNHSHGGMPPPIGQEVSGVYREMVYCLTHPPQSLTREQQEFMEHGGNPDVLDVAKGGIGKNKLFGLGRTCGQGPIEDCVDRVYRHLQPSLAKFPTQDILNLAAGRIARMSSEKKAQIKNGKWHINQRN